MSKGTKGQCTWTTIAMIQVRIEGKPHPEGFPRCPDDDGLIQEFLKWQLEAKVFPVSRAGGVVGGGYYLGYFSPRDAHRVEQWLKGRVSSASGDAK